MRRMLPALGFAVMLSVVTTGGVAIAMTSALTPEPPAAADLLRVNFLDSSGGVRSAPHFDVDGALPGMPRQTSAVVLRNDGTVESTFEFEVVVDETQRRRPLSDVLRVVLRESTTNEVVYRGPLSRARFESSTRLAPGEQSSYTMALTWPDGGAADNAYQGRQMTFALRVHAAQADAQAVSIIPAS